jgi:hypothetical protein
VERGGAAAERDGVSPADHRRHLGFERRQVRARWCEPAGVEDTAQRGGFGGAGFGRGQEDAAHALLSERGYGE